jgi:hypothetical protein
LKTEKRFALIVVIIAFHKSLYFDFSPATTLAGGANPLPNAPQNTVCLFSPGLKGASPSLSLSVLWRSFKCKELPETAHWKVDCQHPHGSGAHEPSLSIGSMELAALNYNFLFYFSCKTNWILLIF